MQTNGLHHVTAIAGDPRANVNFYADVLGLRPVKRTVNFDDPSTYHFYYGDAVGTPGTVLTFFPFPAVQRGRPGRGQPTETAFVVPDGSIDYWSERLESHGVDADPPAERFDETVLRFRDHDGQPLSLVTGESDVDPWVRGPVPTAHAIRGFHGVTLHSLDLAATASVLEVLGYDRVDEEGDRIRYRADGDRASTIDLLTRGGPRGRPGVGTIHHVAVRTPDDETQLAWRGRLADVDQRTTLQKDRQYFRSIYFREPGGILFEIATDGPGFARDESVEELGTALKLPAWLEDDRETISRQLPSLER